MEKLIELLNEYRTEKGERSLNEFEVSQTLDSLNYLRLFIQWLVDNDKIDFNFVERVWSWDFIYDMDSPYYYSCTCEDLKEYDEVDRVLMLLAIQDEPIEFLLSIIK